MTLMQTPTLPDCPGSSPLPLEDPMAPVQDQPPPAAQSARGHHTTVLLADRHGLFLAGMQALLQDSYAVTLSQANSAEDLVATIKIEQPRILVLNPMLGNTVGAELVRRIHDDCPGVKILCLTERRDPALAAEVLLAGAAGYLSRENQAADLLAAVRALEHGAAWLCRDIASGDVRQLLRSSASCTRLTDREVAVLRHLLRGRTMKYVARILGIAPRTVAFHKYRAMEVLGVRNNAELMEAARGRGLLD